jgi:glutamine synthetase
MVDDIRSWLTEHQIRTVRVEGVSLDGQLIGKFLSPEAFLSYVDSKAAFCDVAFGLDLGNDLQFGFEMPAWRGDLRDIYMNLDLSTLVKWSDGRAAVMGDFWDAHGEPISACPRNALRSMVDRVAEAGYTVKCTVEIEASLFEESIQAARAKGYRGLTPVGGSAGWGYAIAKSGDWDHYMTAVSDRLTDLGIPWEAFSDEGAEGQFEFNIAPSDPLLAADRWLRTRQVMREVAFEQGRSVSFMAKTSDAYGQASHVNLSLQNDDANAFYAESGPSDVMKDFIGGVMATLIPSMSFAMPFITSYRRLVRLEGPPTTATWGVGNKTAAVRAITGHPKYSRIECRTVGADANVYLVMAAILAGGLAGITEHIEPPDPCDDLAWCLPEDVQRLPISMSAAADALDADELLTSYLGKGLVDYWLGTRRWEWLQFHTQCGDTGSKLTDWELQRYFELP